MIKRACIAAVVGGVLIAAGPVRAAPTLTSDRQCYAADRDAMTLSGAGFTPNGAVDLLFASASAVERTSLNAALDGSLVLRRTAPKLSDFEALSPGFTLSVTASDRVRQGETPTEASVVATSVIVSEWSVDVPAWNRSSYASLRRTTTVSAYGWTILGPTLYAHFVRAGRLVRTVEVGALQGPCGSLTRRMREFPFRPVPAGTYRVQFDASVAYHHRRSDNYVVYRTVKVRQRDAVR